MTKVATKKEFERHTNDDSRFVVTYVSRLERSECTRFRYSMGINL